RLCQLLVAQVTEDADRDIRCGIECGKKSVVLSWFAGIEFVQGAGDRVADGQVRSQRSQPGYFPCGQLKVVSGGGELAGYGHGHIRTGAEYEDGRHNII